MADRTFVIVGGGMAGAKAAETLREDGFDGRVVIVAEEPEAPAEPQEDEKEVLARIQKNMRASEEKLSKKELGEPTLQTQRDALADLDKLINRRGPDWWDSAIRKGSRIAVIHMEFHNDENELIATGGGAYIIG